MVYVDTSVLVAYYVPEPASEKVQRTLSRQRRVAISPLVETEFYSALSRKVRMAELDIADARKVASMFDLHLADHLFDVVPIDVREYRIAQDWLAQFSIPLRTLDVLHLAAAFCNDMAMLTADHALGRSGEELGVKVKLI